MITAFFISMVVASVIGIAASIAKAIQFSSIRYAISLGCFALCLSYAIVCLILSVIS
jgi:hypothetical protein